MDICALIIITDRHLCHRRHHHHHHHHRRRRRHLLLHHHQHHMIFFEIIFTITTTLVAAEQTLQSPGITTNDPTRHTHRSSVCGLDTAAVDVVRGK